MNIPDTLRVGDTSTWTDSIPLYPAGDGWTLAYFLQSKDKPTIIITASASGDDYAISNPYSTTKDWIAGDYFWQAYVYKGTPPVFTEKYTLEVGHLTILPDITQALSTDDLRSHAKKIIDEIETVMEVKASGGDISGYSIGGRSASKYTWEEMIKARSFYKTEYERELEAEAIAKGLDSPRRIGVRFQRP